MPKNNENVSAIAFLMFVSLITVVIIFTENIPASNPLKSFLMNTFVEPIKYFLLHV